MNESPKPAPRSFEEAIGQALDALRLPKCCLDDGIPRPVSDHFGGRVRKFSVLCPNDHLFSLSVFAPDGRRWPR